VFWPNGQIKSRGLWRDGLRYGEHRTWHENGHVHTIETWNGDRDRTGRSMAYDAGGNLLVDGQYDLGYRVGEWRTYYENGQLESVGSWEPVDPQDRRRGQRRTGQWLFLFQSGAVDEERSGRYVMGDCIP